MFPTAQPDALPPNRMPYRPTGCLTAQPDALPPNRMPYRPTAPRPAGTCRPPGRMFPFPVRRLKVKQREDAENRKAMTKKGTL